MEVNPNLKLYGKLTELKLNTTETGKILQIGIVYLSLFQLIKQKY